jgi:hypothetical protein
LMRSNSALTGASAWASQGGRRGTSDRCPPRRLPLGSGTLGQPHGPHLDALEEGFAGASAPRSSPCGHDPS